MEPRWVELGYKVLFVLVHSARVAECAAQPFSVDLVQIQQKERLGSIVKSTWGGGRGRLQLNIGMKLMSSPCSLRSDMISERFLWQVIIKLALENLEEVLVLLEESTHQSPG
jgi:hypothetical protein